MPSSSSETPPPSPLAGEAVPEAPSDLQRGNSRPTQGRRLSSAGAQHARHQAAGQAGSVAGAAAMVGSARLPGPGLCYAFLPPKEPTNTHPCPLPWPFRQPPGPPATSYPAPPRYMMRLAAPRGRSCRLPVSLILFGPGPLGLGLVGPLLVRIYVPVQTFINFVGVSRHSRRRAAAGRTKRGQHVNTADRGPGAPSPRT
mgnify:CR=1 FL=1